MSHKQLLINKHLSVELEVPVELPGTIYQVSDSCSSYLLKNYVWGWKLAAPMGSGAGSLFLLTWPQRPSWPVDRTSVPYSKPTALPHCVFPP